MTTGVVVDDGGSDLHRRDADRRESAERTVFPRRNLCVLCVSAVRTPFAFLALRAARLVVVLARVVCVAACF